MIAAGHLGEIQLLSALLCDGSANQPTTVDRHEVDHFLCAQRCGANEVGFVFAIWIICNDDNFSGGDFVNDFVDGVEGKGWHGLRKSEWESGRVGEWESGALVMRFDLRLAIDDFGFLNEEEDLIQHWILGRLGQESVIGRDAAEKSFPEGEIVGVA